MLEKRKCSHCEKSYEVAFARCPECRATNEIQPKEFKHLSVVTFWKQIALFFIGWAGLKIIAFFVELIACIIGKVDIGNEEALKIFVSQPNISMIINGLAYGFTIIALLLILFNEIPTLFPSFKKWQPYVAAIVSVFAIILISNAYTTILAIFNVDIFTNGNQGSIDDISNSLPFWSILIFGFIGPVVEELTYRVGLFTTLKRVNKYVAYIVTILVFALIHFNFSFDGEVIVNELLNLPYYLIGGIILTIVYDKFGFAASVSAHITYNVLTFLPFCMSFIKVIY